MLASFFSPFSWFSNRICPRNHLGSFLNSDNNGPTSRSSDSAGLGVQGGWSANHILRNTCIIENVSSASLSLIGLFLKGVSSYKDYVLLRSVPLCDDRRGHTPENMTCEGGRRTLEITESKPFLLQVRKLRFKGDR